MALPCDLLHEKESEAHSILSFLFYFIKSAILKKKKYFSNKKAEINLRHFSKTLGLLSEEKTLISNQTYLSEYFHI